MSAADDDNVREVVPIPGGVLQNGIALPRPVRAGWLRLRLAPATNTRAVRLLLHHPPAGADRGSRIVEHVVDLGAGEDERLLHVAAPVLSAEVVRASDDDPPLADVDLHALRPLALLRAALARDVDETLAAIGWWLLGKKVRARNRLKRLLGDTQRLAYRAWLSRTEQERARETAKLARWYADLGVKPRFAVVVTSRGSEDDAGVARSLAPIDLQVVVPACVTVLPARAVDIALAFCDRPDWDWLMVLPAGVQLARGSLLRAAAAVHARPGLRAIYGDSDVVAADGGRISPHFTPQWNEAYFLARDYVGAFAVSRAVVDEARELVDAQDASDALLLAAAHDRRDDVMRIDRVLTHRADACRVSRAAEHERRRAMIERHIQREAPRARAVLQGPGSRVIWPLPEPAPLVSLVVPTRDRIDLLKPCIESLRHGTAYPALEILIADNGSTEAATRDYFAALGRDDRVRVLDCPGPFNFSAINNAAVTEARGSVVGFINNDIEAVDVDWLAEMVAQAVRCGIGAVGALLVYANGLVQHAGVVMGVGGYAGHAHRFFHPDAPGYMGRIGCQQHVAAVTAACLVVEKAKFLEVGGFDETAFAVAYNDVDLCLKLRAAGYENLYTPFARLMHKESASRVRDYAPERAEAYARECAALAQKWGAVIANDPYYHPALTRADETFSLD